jgi:hypothetical protein
MHGLKLLQLTIFVLAVTLLIATGCVSQRSISQTSLQGDRILSIAVTTAQDDNFDRAFAKAREVGIQATNLALSWEDLETAPKYYQPAPNFLAIANSFYPYQNMKIALEINPIDTTTLRIPKDLRNKSIDDPSVIARYNQLLSWVFQQIPDLELVSLTVGNEIDSYLGDDPTKWRQYQTFFEAVSAYARSQRPKLSVGVKATFEGLTGQAQEFLKALNTSSDVIMGTYYPLEINFEAKSVEVVDADFKKLTLVYRERPVFLLEVGYPSSPLCGSSEESQAAFIAKVFEAWDKYHSQIKLISFTWLTDLSAATIDEMISYYGISDRCFTEFLATLGLRTQFDLDKMAFTQLKQEASQRGW